VAMTAGGPPNPPPPPPPQARKPARTEPVEVNPAQMDELAGLAMILREEQVKARIVHYKAELETNAELDAITAEVVAELQMLQAQVAKAKGPEERDAGAMEAEQIKTLTKLLTRVFRTDAPSTLIEQRTQDIARRMMKLFFESALHDRVSAAQKTRLKTIQYPEQGVFYVLHRYENRFQAELENFTYDDEETKASTLELLTRMTNDLRVGFLTRRSPELKRLLGVTQKSLVEFLMRGIPPHVSRIAREVIVEAETARQANSVGYKVLPAVFPAFRQSFERRFMKVLIENMEPRLVKELSASEDAFRDDTVAFVQSPEIYSEMCQLVCDGVYEFLCNEGFLELPSDWRTAVRSR
jgi:hypothetical protein